MEQQLILSLVVFVGGMLIGALTTFATFSGRMATLETKCAAIERELGQLRDEIQSSLEGLRRAVNGQPPPLLGAYVQARAPHV